MHDFISWMHLEEMYDRFRENAIEVSPEDSLPYYTMPEEKGILE